MMPLKALLIYPEVLQSFWSLTHALRFLGKRTWSPPLGLLTVATMLPSKYEQRLRDLNVVSLDDEDLAWADYVFLSARDVQRESSHRIIERCKRLGVKVLVGGPLSTIDPDAFKSVDHLVLAVTRRPYNTSRNEARSLWLMFTLARKEKSVFLLGGQNLLAMEEYE